MNRYESATVSLCDRTKIQIPVDIYHKVFRNVPLWLKASADDPCVDVALLLQVLCVRSLRCAANGVDDGEPSAPRTEKTTTQDCILLSPRNEVLHDAQSSQVEPQWRSSSSLGNSTTSAFISPVPPLLHQPSARHPSQQPCFPSSWQLQVHHSFP